MTTKFGIADEFKLHEELNPVFDPALAEALASRSDWPLADKVRDEALWAEVRKAFLTDPNQINLNHGGVCPQPRSVQEAEYRLSQQINYSPAPNMWWVLEDAREIVRYRLARLAELPAEEVAIMRNTTEALNNVTMGIPLQPGDEIVLANQDYPNMKKAWQNRAEREGLVLRWVDLPMPSEDPDVLAQPYIEAFSERTKVVNITHMVHWTGQVMPVRRIADAARARGIWSIGDCSHSFCQIPYRIRELGTDFAGTSLHKWLCAPFGTGMLWMRQEHIGKIFPLFLHRDHEPRGTDIRKFEGQGTRAYAAELAIGHAIDFHEGLGTELKHARLCYLKSYWAEQAMQRIPGLRLHTPLSHNFSGSLGLIYFEGRKMDIYSIEQRLDQEYGIHTVAFEAPGVWGLRVSVHIFTQLGELDQFVDALATLCAEEDHAAAS